MEKSIQQQIDELKVQVASHERQSISRRGLSGGRGETGEQGVVGQTGAAGALSESDIAKVVKAAKIAIEDQYQELTHKDALYNCVHEYMKNAGLVDEKGNAILIKGDTGAVGQTGAAGRDAAPAKDGIQGIQGLPGTKGDRGATGAAGIGKDSTVPGARGAVGETGAVGQEGHPGAAYDFRDSKFRDAVAAIVLDMLRRGSLEKR